MAGDDAHMIEQRLDEWLDAAKRIALAAGEAILAAADSAADADEKADGSPVTRADRAAHKVIVAGLAALRPALPILSEEGDVEQSRKACAAAEAYWLVDPLDGTKELIKGNGEYTVNIALIRDATPVLGVVYSPALRRLYYAARGRGAWRSDADDPPVRLSGRKQDGPLTAVVSRSHGNAETEAFLDRLGVKERIRRGSSLKMCAVAEGEADIYPRLGPTCYWDTAAGAAVAEAAGCSVEDLAGAPLRYDCADSVRHEGFIARAHDENRFANDTRRSVGGADGAI